MAGETRARSRDTAQRMTYSLAWLADVLRSAGLKVEERPDWKERGRGDVGPIRGVICHHTAGPLQGDHPSLEIVEHGRQDLPGPLSQLVLSRDGTFFVVGAGRCNHAGRGAWHGVTAGNSQLIGIEAENAGTGQDPWPAVQIDAYTRGVAAILGHIGADSVMVAGHKEFALPRGRKTDPSFDMIAFRERVAAIMGGKVPMISVPETDPKRSMLRKGDQGNSVRELQTKLDIVADGGFGPETDRAVRAFQTAHGLVPDGLVGPATWAALGT